MKAIIKVTGQIKSNFKLCTMLGYAHLITDGPFNPITMHYSSVSLAKKAIKEAYRNFIAEYPEEKNSISGIRKRKDNSGLFWDASKAILIKN